MDTTATGSGKRRRLNQALSDRAVKAAKASGRMFDGNGLFLLVTERGPNVSKIWKQRITVNQACLTLRPTSPLSVFRSLEAGFAERARKAMDAVAARRNTVSGVWSAMEPARWARGADGPAWRSRFRLFSRDGEGRVSRAV